MTTDIQNSLPSFDLLGELDGWKVYKNKEGFIEAYKTVGEKSSELSYPDADSLRMVTNIRDIEVFIKAMVEKNVGPLDRDYLEMLMNKIKLMKTAGALYYSNKTMETNRKAFEATRKDMNEFYTLLKKRGYNPDRFDKPVIDQPKLF